MQKKSVIFPLVVVSIVLLTSMLLVTPDKSLEELAPKYIDDTSAFVTLDGFRIHYRDEGSGFPIVLIHGTGASLHTWDDWTALLKQHYRVIRLDLPGYGLTGKDEQKRYSSMDYVALLDSFLVHLEIDDFYLAGNSLGGQVAWLYTALYNMKVRKLVLLDPSGFLFDRTPNIIALAKTPVLNLLARYITPRFFVKQNIKEVYYDNDLLREETVDRYRDLTLYKGNREAFIDRAMIEREDNTQYLSKIDTPSLIIWGEADDWIPVSDGVKFNTAIKGSRLVVMPKTGHVPMEERPAESLAIALKFLND